MVSQNDGDHRLCHWNETREQTRVVSTFGLNRGWLGCRSDSSLFDREAAGWLDGSPENDGLAGRNAAEDSAVSVGFSRNSWPSGFDSAGSPAVER